MSKDFSTMKSEVGNNVQDTSTAFATIIGTYINNRYFDILRRTNTVQAVNPDYSFTLSAGSTLVSLPANFGKEISVFDDTNNTELDYIDFNKLISERSDNIGDTGTPTEYSIIDVVNSSGVRGKFLRPQPYPSGDITVLMPYNIQPLALSSDGGYTVVPVEDGIVAGATADAWRYKRQFAKADVMEMQYEKWVNTYVWDKENQPNQVKMMMPCPYDRDYV